MRAPERSVDLAIERRSLWLKTVRDESEEEHELTAKYELLNTNYPKPGS